MAKFIDAWSKTTGQKQAKPVPEHFPGLFSDLVRTPPRKQSEEAAPAETNTPATPEKPKEK